MPINVDKSLYSASRRMLLLFCFVCFCFCYCFGARCSKRHTKTNVHTHWVTLRWRLRLLNEWHERQQNRLFGLFSSCSERNHSQPTDKKETITKNVCVLFVVVDFLCVALVDVVIVCDSICARASSSSKQASRQSAMKKEKKTHKTKQPQSVCKKNFRMITASSSSHVHSFIIIFCLFVLHGHTVITAVNAIAAAAVVVVVDFHRKISKLKSPSRRFGNFKVKNMLRTAGCYFDSQWQ